MLTLDLMIEFCAAAVITAGVPQECVHKELFGTPALKRPLNGGSEANANTNASANNQGGFDGATVTVISDGIERVLQVPYRGTPVLEVALAAGIDAPYACKAGVCSTCRARVLEGEVTMDANFTLEPHEVNRGFVLTCQSHPVSEQVRITFDER